MPSQYFPDSESELNNYNDHLRDLEYSESEGDEDDNGTEVN